MTPKQQPPQSGQGQNAPIQSSQSQSTPTTPQPERPTTRSRTLTLRQSSQVPPSTPQDAPQALSRPLNPPSTPSARSPAPPVTPANQRITRSHSVTSTVKTPRMGLIPASQSQTLQYSTQASSSALIVQQQAAMIQALLQHPGTFVSAIVQNASEDDVVAKVAELVDMIVELCRSAEEHCFNFYQSLMSDNRFQAIYKSRKWSSQLKQILFPLENIAKSHKDSNEQALDLVKKLRSCYWR